MLLACQEVGWDGRQRRYHFADSVRFVRGSSNVRYDRANVNLDGVWGWTGSNTS